MKTPLLIAALAAGLIATTASAEGPRGHHGFNGKGPQGFGGPAMDFSQLDVDGDGQVTAAEISAQAGLRFAAADADGNGALSAEELIAKAQEADASRIAERVARMIEHMDDNEDGVLQVEEMQPRGNQSARIERMIERFDTDEDGAVSQAEFDAAKAAHEERRGERGERRGGHETRRGGN